MYVEIFYMFRLFGPVVVNDLQIFHSPSPTPPAPLKKCRFHFLVQNNAQCSETYEKSNFRFLVFEIFNHSAKKKLSSQKMHML